MEESKLTNRENKKTFTKTNIITKQMLENKTMYFFFKRVLDSIGSLVGLLLLIPLFLVIAIFMKIEETSAPIFFLKPELEKMGKNLKCTNFDLCV